jgi:hypothetical protein
MDNGRPTSLHQLMRLVRMSSFDGNYLLLASSLQYNVFNLFKASPSAFPIDATAFLR